MTHAGWDLVEAIHAALRVLGLMELPEDEIPPEHIWHHSERMAEWFEAVKAKRADRIGNIDVPDGEDLAENELTRGLKKK